MIHLTPEYYEWLSKIREQQEEAMLMPTEALSAIPVVCHSIFITGYDIIKNAYGNRAFVSAKVIHNSGEEFIINTRESWYDIINRLKPVLTEQELMNLIYSDWLKYQKTETHINITGCDKENRELVKYNIDISST